MMSEELKAARILFIISAILTFLGALASLGIGILVSTSGIVDMSVAGGLIIAGSIFLTILGGLKLWCANLVKEERKLKTAGILGIILGVISPGIIFVDMLSLIAGILVLVKNEESNNKNTATKSRKKKSSKK